MVVVIDFKEKHFSVTPWAAQGIISEREDDVVPPFGKTENEWVFALIYCFAKVFITFAVSGIKSVITCHFEVPFRYMLDQELDKINGRKGFTHKNIIFVAVVVESYIFTIVGVNAAKCNDRAPQISADVFEDGMGIAEARFCIHIKPVFVFPVNVSLCFFERRSDSFFHEIQKGGLERFS